MGGIASFFGVAVSLAIGGVAVGRGRHRGVRLDPPAAASIASRFAPGPNRRSNRGAPAPVGASIADGARLR